jgi:transposase-like protein
MYYTYKRYIHIENVYMSQHFLLSAAARTLSLKAVCRMSDEEAHAALTAIRWADNGGKPYCPKCGCLEFSAITTRKLWKCKGCSHQYSVTSGTIFSSRKMQVRDYLLAVAIFVNGAKGISALQLSRDLQVQHKTAFVLRTSYAKRWAPKCKTLPCRARWKWMARTSAVM